MGEDRRRFLNRLIACLGGVAALGAMGAGAWYSLPPKHRGESALPERPVSPFSVEGLDGKVTRLVSYGREAALVVRRNGEWGAFLAVCTHLGCRVEVGKQKNGFSCPCHAGRFNLQGEPQAGPVSEPLRPIPVQIRNGRLVLLPVA